MSLGEVFSRVHHLLLYYEAAHCPGAGITAVAVKQQGVLQGQAVAVVPWSEQMEQAQQAVEAGKVQNTGFQYPVRLNARTTVEARVLFACVGEAVTLYIDIPGFFKGKDSPYDTPQLKRDCIVFGLAVKALLDTLAVPADLVVWCADWQCSPAAALLKFSHDIVTMLHNDFDEYLGVEIADFDCAELRVFAGRQTALEILIDASDVILAVNAGYVWSLANEPVHCKILAPHLQNRVHRIRPCPNAAFLTLSPEHRALADLIHADAHAGAKRLAEIREKARRRLPDSLRRRTRHRVLVVLMGRLVAQKQHDVGVEAIRSLLGRQPDLGAHFVFALAGAPEAARLERIKLLVEEFPEHVSCFEKRISFFDDLMSAAAFQILASSWEPHGGAFYGTVLPIARAIDGLVAQICPYHPSASVIRLANRWHRPADPPNGYLFREEAVTVEELRSLVEGHWNASLTAVLSMAAALDPVLEEAIDLLQYQPEQHARLVLAALRYQQSRTWEQNIGVVEGLLDFGAIERPAEQDSRIGDLTQLSTDSTGCITTQTKPEPAARVPVSI